MNVDKLSKCKISEMIEYQSEGIVSKQIIKKPNGNLTLFAFDSGESLSEHTSPYEAFILIIEGEMEITIGGIPYILNAGEKILMPQNIAHGLVARSRSKVLLTMIK